MIKQKIDRYKPSLAEATDRVTGRWLSVGLALLLMIGILLGCGGSGGTNSTEVTVQITPSSTTLAARGLKTFIATVSGSTNSDVTWTCQGGSIDQSGNYTAPAVAGTATVTATSVSNPSVKAVAQITVTASSVVTVAISPTTASITPGGKVQFSATVSGSTNPAVTWSTTLGSIDSNGLFTAPNVASTCTVKATSVADATAFAKVTVSVSTIAVQVTPITPTLGTNQMVQFSASISNLVDQRVTWSATGGTITATGLFHAGETGGTYSVTATSVGHPSSATTVPVIVNSINVFVTPTPVTVVIGQTQQFASNVTGATTSAVTWTTSSGSISSTGLFTAPATAGTVTVTATSSADPSRTGTSTVTVVSPSTYFYDFNSGVPGVWTPSTNEATPNGVKFLGRMSGANTAQLVLASLTTHSSLTVSFDLYVIGAWAGISNSSTLGVSIGGTSAFNQSFSNILGDTQSYPLSGTNAPATGSYEQNTLGYTSDPAILYNDSSYHLTCTLAHTGSTVTIVFAGNLTGTLSQMAWGLKNVRITANP